MDYTYSKDLLSAISTASGTDYSFTYGVFDLTTAVKAGSRTLISHSYTNDQNRRLSRSVYGNGDAVSYSYDSFGRTTAVTYGDTGSTVSYAYDANSNLGQLTDGISGRVNRYSYDFLDRLMRYEESGDGYSNIVQWGYDDENNLSSQTQTLNGSTYASTYAYDKDNRLTKATEGTISANYTYDSFSRMTGLTAKNGSTSVVNTAVTYVDPSSSATSTQVKTWNNGKAAYTYTYDNKGNITSITGGGQEFDYRYDRYGRLISAEDYPGGYVWTYTYDDGGNITQRGLTDYHNNKNPNSILATYTYGNADWPDLLTAFNGKSITYDAIGNPLSDGTWTYAWQHGRQLASMSKSGSSITYGYNADGKRISKTVNGTTYNFSYLGDQLTEMTWGSNKLHFTYDSTGPASVTYNGNRYFYLKNAQGDVTGLVNASGTQVVSYTYNPWGAPMSTGGTMASTLGAANPLRYRGYVYDSETGLYYLSSRYYNPVWGRFINADGYASTGQGFTGYNMFAYCNGNPLRNRDSGGSLPHNTMTMMTDGGPRDAQYYIKLQARRHTMNTSGTYVRATGVTYTASSRDINSNAPVRTPCNFIRYETGNIVSTPAFSDAALISHPFANIDIEDGDISTRIPLGNSFAYDLFKNGVGISYAASKFGNSGVIYSVRADAAEMRIEWEISNVWYDDRGASSASYACVSMDARVVALMAFAAFEGYGWLLAYMPQLAPAFSQMFIG